MATSNRKRKTRIKNRTIITNTHPDCLISEQLRMVHTNIKFMMTEQNKKTFLITSPGDGEGKSTIVTNLAVLMAQQKKKVLLVDANLRNPALHIFFNTQNSSGLTDVLTGRLTFGEAVFHTEIWRLDLLTTGVVPRNPAELLGSQIVQELLNKAKQQYDAILIDSNAMLEVTDTNLLANQCDGVVLIIKSGKTKYKKAIETKKILEFANANLVGVVLNQ